MPPSRTSRLSWRVPVCAMFMALFVTGIVFFLIRLAGSHGQSGFVAPNSEFAKFSHNRSVVKSDSANRISCLLGNFRCNTSQTCISLDSRCDGVVDCPDAEDEQYCVCAFRMPPAKFCDKYPDCFDQSDENFCSYCPMNSFNCENGQCIPRSHVCDSKIDCRNAMDENFCFRLSTNIPIASVEDDTPAMLKTGFLLRNQGGIWYPVCSNPYDAMQDALASHACVSITANPLASSTHQHRSFANVQGYLNKSGVEFMYHYYGRFVHWNGCLTDQGIFVTCNDVLCGFNPKLLLPHPRRQVRIVGGQNSEPGAWPWHGAVYKNGTYSCGATLISNRWLVSAAHCFLNHWRNYYEVQLGMLRRRSFTPHQKVYRISHVIQHPSFSIITLDYDIALLKTAEPVTFGFWVRPICLPDPPKVEKFGSICTAIGWGDTGEKADDSDNLQEVHIPLTVCRKSDRWLCAGFFEGGRDACQGDSGGPLMCLKDDSMSWYIAGVISTGIGCARPRTPGRYTRVSYFTSWMREVMTSTNYGVAPLSKCPGWRCSALGGGSCLPPKRICDGNVDCYDAQDEVKCKKGRKVKFYNN